MDVILKNMKLNVVQNQFRISISTFLLIIIYMSYNEEKFKLLLDKFMQNIKVDSIENYYFIMDNLRFHNMKIIKDFVIHYEH